MEAFVHGFFMVITIGESAQNQRIRESENQSETQTQNPGLRIRLRVRQPARVVARATRARPCTVAPSAWYRITALQEYSANAHSYFP